MNNQNIIEPHNLPLWTAAGFIIALLALLALTVAVMGMYRNSATTMVMQAQVLLLNQKFEQLANQSEKKSLPAHEGQVLKR